MLLRRTLHACRHQRYLFSAYQKEFEASINNPEKFWGERAKKINWSKPPSISLDSSKAPVYRWFPDATLNITKLCLDDNLERGDGKQVAYYYESPVTNTTDTITFERMHSRVNKLAHSLSRDFKVKKGDRVIIYMPMIEEAIVAMLACARIGAVHSVVFGGFSAEELGYRISDTDAKLIITATAGKEPNRIIKYKPIVDEAIKISGASGVQTIVFRRAIQPDFDKKSNDHDYSEVQKAGSGIAPLIVESTHPLYILYTSGSTGHPKGVIRDQGGTAVVLNYTFDKILGMKRGQTLFCGSDIGWVVGHSFIVYGPLMQGVTSILFEGKPVGTPDAGTVWRICEKHKVNHLYSSPTAIRSIRKEDSEGSFIKSHDLSNLHSVSFAGERCDIPTYEWLAHQFPNRFLNDNYWQTESGYLMLSNFKNLETFKFKPGSATKPTPGFKFHIVDENTGQPSKVEEKGLVYIKLPTPPSFMSNLWKNERGFVQKYFSQLPGYYFTGDYGYVDRDGYYHIMSRADDVINTAGHRLSTGQMEEVIMSDPNIGEAVVIGIKDELKGEIPVAFVTLKVNSKLTAEAIEKEIVQLIRVKIGPVASFKTCLLVSKLPKTRSGKYLRHVIRKICHGESYKLPPTIEDPSALDAITEAVKQRKITEGTKIDFEEKN